MGTAREATRASEYTASGGRKLQDNTIFSDRIRLNLVSSFTGKDQLLARLEANNTTAFSGAVTGTNMTRTSWDTTNNPDNSVQLGKLFYRFPVGDKINVIVDAIGGEFYDNFNTINPLLSSTPIGSRDCRCRSKYEFLPRYSKCSNIPKDTRSNWSANISKKMN